MGSIKLLDTSGQLEQYSWTRTDGTTNDFGIMLGNLGGDLVLNQNVKRNTRIVSTIANQLPDTAVSINKLERTQPQLMVVV